MERICGRKRHRTDEPSPQEQFLINGRKKQRTDNSPPTTNHLAEEPEPEQQPLEDISQWQYPPEFWDRLSQIPLIHSAIEELERRTGTRLSCPSPPIELAKDFTPAVAVELVRSARHGGPDLRDLRGYPPPPDSHQPAVVMSSPPRSRATKSTNPTTLPVSKTTTNTKSTTPYNRGFEQHLADHAIHPTWRSRKLDLEDTRTALAVSRRSLSPSRLSDGVFETFQMNYEQAKDEDDVKAHEVPVIIEPRQHDHPMALSTLFGNLRPLTDGTLAPANPDIYYGAYPEALDRSIRNDLAGDIIPSTMLDKPIAPNFFMEVKGPMGAPAVAARQARYNGAFGARAMHALQNYGKDEPEYDSSAYAFSSTYHDGVLKLYAHHMTAPSTQDGQPEYHMNPVHTSAMTAGIDDFRRGVTAFRNARDLAKQHRDNFIQSANTRASQARMAAAQADAAEPNEDEIPTPRDDVDPAQHVALQDAGGEPCTEDDSQEAEPDASHEPSDDPSMSFTSSLTHIGLWQFQQAFETIFQSPFPIQPKSWIEDSNVAGRNPMKSEVMPVGYKRTAAIPSFSIY